MSWQPLVDYVENVLRKEKDVPGVDIQIMQDHEVLFRYMSGTCDRDRTKPVSDRDLYYIYSCTKPMTCAAAMQLVEQGKMGLDDPVAKYLPVYGDAFLLQNGRKVRPQRTMTLRHLFTMSAGLDYTLKAAPILQILEKNPEVSTRQLVESFIQSPLNFEPGTTFRYSLCHDMLAA